MGSVRSVFYSNLRNFIGIEEALGTCSKKTAGNSAEAAWQARESADSVQIGRTCEKKRRNAQSAGPDEAGPVDA